MIIPVGGQHPKREEQPNTWEILMKRCKNCEREVIKKCRPFLKRGNKFHRRGILRIVYYSHRKKKCPKKEGIAKEERAYTLLKRENILQQDTTWKRLLFLKKTRKAYEKRYTAAALIHSTAVWMERVCTPDVPKRSVFLKIKYTNACTGRVYTSTTPIHSSTLHSSHTIYITL